MKHLLLILLTLTLLSCGKQKDKMIQGQWTIVHYETFGNDQTNQIPQNERGVNFMSDDVISICNNDHYGIAHYGYLGNYNAYWVSGDYLMDGCDVEFKMEFQGNNRVKLIGIAHSDLIIILEK